MRAGKACGGAKAPDRVTGHLAPAAGARVRLAGIGKRYGEVTAADAIDLDVAAGEFLTLLGPSGSGKTTLLNIVAGFVPPDHGAVLVNERPVTEVPPHRRGFGMVFQSYALFPHMTVFDNIAFPLRRRGMSAREIADGVAAALTLVSLEGLAKRHVAQLSGGQQQRVAFARAVVFRPSLLQMDEPLSALDRNLRQQLQIEPRRLQRQLGITVILVTHDQEQALAMSDRIAGMDRGRIQQVGPSRELYEAPRTAFVARFFGESNILDTEARADGPGLVLAAGGIRVAPAPAGARVGEAVRVLIRPDRIGVAAPGAQPAHDAVVQETTYLGGSVRAVLQLAGGPALIARLAGAAPLETGDGLRITWADRDVTPLAGG